MGPKRPKQLRVLGLVGTIWGAASLLALARCHPTEPPPVLPPPKPTNPTSLALASFPAEEVLDASLISDGGQPWEAGFEFEANARASAP